MVGKGKDVTNDEKVLVLHLNDPYKTFDCLSHDLIIAKVSTYGFSLPALKLIHEYLSNRQQRTKINQDFSSWAEVLSGLPQGSLLEPKLFNIFVSDLFLEMKETEYASYADDNILFYAGKAIENLSSYLQESYEKLFK